MFVPIVVRPSVVLLNRMVEGAVAWVEPETAQRLLADWTPRELYHVWRKTPERPARPGIPLAVKREVYARDGHTCGRCGATERLSLDHIQPWSMGGRHTVDNLRVLCVFCNSRRGAPEDWRDELKVS